MATLAKGGHNSLNAPCRPPVSRDALDERVVPVVVSESFAPESSSGWAQGTDEDESELPGWEQARPVVVSAPIGVLTWILGGSLLGFSVVAVCVWFMAQSFDKVVERHPEGEPALIQDEKHEEMPQEEAPRFDAADSIEHAKKIATQFLEAKTAAALEPLVRTPETSVARLRAWYARYPYIRPGVKVVGLRNSIKVVGDTVSMNVQLDDFSVKKMHLVRGRDGYKIDWESWVAWSSIPWDDLFDTKPSAPVEVRVKCKRANYYNGLFNDDEKWFAVRLSHPGFDRSMYGYIDTTQPRFYRLVAELIRGAEIRLTLNISYPPNSKFNNQVSIVDYVQPGWVRSTLPADGEEESASK